MNLIFKYFLFLLLKFLVWKIENGQGNIIIKYYKNNHH